MRTKYDPAISKNSKKKMILLGSAIILLIIVIAYECNYNLETENYFFTKNFDGNVVIIHNPNAKRSIFHKRNVDYFVPDSGIIWTHKPLYEGRKYINYYQKNENNGWDTLTQQFPGEELDSTKSRIYFPRTLSYSKGHNKVEFDVTTFYIGKKQTSEVNSERFFFERDLELKLLGIEGKN